MSFGYALKKFREGRGLTLRELGKLCEIDHTYIHRLETEERNSPSEETVESLVRNLKLDGRRARMLRILPANKYKTLRRVRCWQILTKRLLRPRQLRLAPEDVHM